MVDYKKQGRRNKINGQIFETKVRQDLEKIGWIVCKWQNQVDLENNKLIHAKHKFNFFTKMMTLGHGFPDFIAYKRVWDGTGYEVIGVEAKSNGYLTKEEKEKCDWLLKNGIFSKILIATKEKTGRNVVVGYKKYEVTQ